LTEGGRAHPTGSYPGARRLPPACPDDGTARAFEPAIGLVPIRMLGLVAAAPGLLLAGILLHRIFARRRDFLLALGLWLALAPPAAMVVVNLVSPGILGQTHDHSAWELFLRIWVVGSLVPVIPAWLWRWLAPSGPDFSCNPRVLAGLLTAHGFFFRRPHSLIPRSVRKNLFRSTFCAIITRIHEKSGLARRSGPGDSDRTQREAQQRDIPG
jgi:hypothetical protein